MLLWNQSSRARAAAPRPAGARALGIIATAALLAPASIAPSQVVINEVHYHPDGTSERDTAAKDRATEDRTAKDSTQKANAEELEFVEIHNAGDTAVDLKSWRIDGGVSYAFPAVTLPPRGFLVIAHEPEVLRRRYGLPADLVCGPFEGRLSNGGEELRLVDASGGVVDELRYRDGGDWPAKADGLGASLQRVVALAPGGAPQNWFARPPTPGRASVVTAATLPPLVSAVERSPLQPTSRDAVEIRARVEASVPVQVELISERDGKRTVLPMAPGPAGVYSATLPPAPDGSVVSYRVVARGRGMIVAAPREGDPSDAYGYYVLDEPRDPEHEIAVFHLLWDGEPSCDPGAWIDGATFVHQGTAYLGVGVKYRGATSCGAPKTGLKVRFRKGARFRRLKKLNFLAGWQDRSLLREKLAWDLFREVGHPHCRAEMAAVYTRGNKFHGLFIAIDEPDADFLERNGLDRDGGLWKMNTSFLGAKHTLPGLPRFERVLAPEDGSGDQALHELEIRLNSLEGRELRDLLLASFDVESLIDYQAIQVVISNEDAYTKNTFLHRAPDGRWTLIPWDLDLSFGQRSLYEDSSHIDTHPLAGTADHPRIGSHGIRYNGLIEAVFGRRSGDYFVRALYARIRALVEKVEGARFMARLDALEASTRREAAADHAKWPRWDSATRDASEHRQHLRAYLAGRTAYLERFLASKEPTTASATRPFGPGEAPLTSEGLPPRPATAYRSFQSIPLPRIVFTEVHFAPKDSPGLEFIELRSLENAPVDVSGWSIPALGYVFPEGSSVPAKAAVVLARDPAALVERHSGLERGRLFGPYTGKLARRGENLRLRDRGNDSGGDASYPATVDLLPYRAEAPWPAFGRNGPSSIELRTLDLDNDAPESWSVAESPEGTPGR